MTFKGLEEGSLNDLTFQEVWAQRTSTNINWQKNTLPIVEA